MPLYLTIPQMAGLTVLALASVAWLIGMNRMLRRIRSRAAALPGLSVSAAPAMPAAPVVLAVPEVAEVLPCPEEAVPHREAVELTPAEKDAFAGLVRQLDGGR